MKEHLPPKTKPETFLIQGRVPKEIYEMVVTIKSGTDWTWDDILTAFCKEFIKEFGGPNENK
jgi:hypothetical protein